MKKYFKSFKMVMNFQPHWFFLIHPFYFVRRNLFKFFKLYAHKLDGKLLDIGCGIKPYKNLFRHCESYVGVDIEKENVQNLADFTYDGKTFPFEDETFDSAICSEVLEHVFEPNFFLKQINRVVKKNGFIIFSVPFLFGEHEQPYDYARYTSFGLKHILKEENFEILSQVKLGNNLSTLSQLLNHYFYNKLYKNKNFFFRGISIFIFSFVNLVGIILSIFPKNDSIYLNNIVIVKKK